MSGITKLWEPGRIGGLELKNRIIYSAMDLRSTDGAGHISDAAVESLAERARHGVGLVCLPGVHAWSVPGVPHGLTISLESDEFIPSLAGAARRVHEQGAKVMVQIGARGTRIEAAHGAPVTTGPTAMRFGYEAAIPRALTAEEIQERVGRLGDAARRAREAGVDMVEIHASTGKLLSMFLSPYSNHRQDEYGGSTAKRTRFLREVIADMRRKAGADYPLSVRLTVDDMVPGGIDREEGLAIARLIDPLVDALQPSVGTQERIWNISCGYFHPQGYMLSATAAVKAMCAKPVIAMGKLGEPALAEAALAEGKADFVSLGRPLLTDPEWLEKAARGDSAGIRRCIGCLNCFTYATRREIQPPRVSCTVNPALLREEEFRRAPRADRPRRIAVVGGGLAGMEAARILADRGHEVDLYERGPALGGQWLAASHSDWKHEQKTLIPWLERELQRAGARVRLNTPATADLFRRQMEEGQGPADVVLATGAVPRDLPLPCPVPGPRLTQGNDVILGRVDLRDAEQRVVVVGGRYVGMEAAILLARTGRRVSVVDAVDIGQGTNPRLLGLYRNLMVDLGVYLYPHSPVLRLTPEGVDVAHLNSMLSLPADLVVQAVGTRPVNELQADIEALGLPCHLIGDCKRIGDALYAMRDAADLALSL